MRKDLGSIVKEFEKRIEENEALLEAWKNVKRNTKKDGSDFSALSKNFDGATIRDCQYSVRPEKEIHVCTRTKSGIFKSDDIGCNCNAKDAWFDVAPERIVKESFLVPYIVLTVSEIFEKIEIRIKQLEKCIENDKKCIEKASEAYTEIIEKMNEVHEVLKSISGKGANNDLLSLRYSMEDVIKNYYFN